MRPVKSRPPPVTKLNVDALPSISHAMI